MKAKSNESKIEKQLYLLVGIQRVVIISYIIASSDSQLLKKTIIYSFVLP